MTKDYETTIVFDGNLDEAAINSEIEKFKALIETHGGSLKTKTTTGRRRLAYKVGNKEFGNFVLLVHDGDNSLVSAMERQLEIDENVLRHLCVRRDKFAPEGELVPLDEGVVQFGEDDVLPIDAVVEAADDVDVDSIS